MSRPLLLRCLECLFPKAHEEDDREYDREYAEAVKSKTKHLLLGTTHYPNFARPKPYVVKDKKTGFNPTQSDIDAKRSEFWRSAPSSGGDFTIWEVLKGASEAMLPKWETRDGTRVKVPGDLARARKKLSLHPFAVAKPDMTLCVDIVGFKYVLPRYVLRDPSNLEGGVQDVSTGAGTRAGDGDEDVDSDSWSEDESGSLSARRHLERALAGCPPTTAPLDHARLRLRLAALADATGEGVGGAAGVEHRESAVAHLLRAGAAFGSAPPGLDGERGWTEARKESEELLLAVLKNLVQCSVGGKRHGVHRELYSRALRGFGGSLRDFASGLGELEEAARLTQVIREDESDSLLGSLPAPPSRTSSLPRGHGEAIDPGGGEGGLPPVAPGMLKKKRAPRRMMSNPMA